MGQSALECSYVRSDCRKSFGNCGSVLDEFVLNQGPCFSSANQK